ncbi:MAG: lantibiotic ABC transporter [Actinobacteria bacterium 13_1_20CM_3_71_11]|nr:MAG: lantibiotic ABC transporter [Actinobacteria bacterium 13_1_20CM_3_71_11]
MSVHCETTTLGVLLAHLGLDLSEPMLFGLGEGLSFVYWDAKYLDFPFLGGRTRPMAVATRLADRLGLAIDVAETASPRKAWQNVARHVDAGRPVGLQLDCYHLDYFTTKVHFGGHIVAMHGYDDSYAYLIDTAPQGGSVHTTRASLAAARAERGPMTARHLSFTLDRAGEPAEVRAVLGTAIRNTATAFLHPPIANLGYRGIAKAAQRVTGWPAHGLARTAVLMESAGTGGALFRNLYRDFLGECATLVDSAALRTGHRLYGEAAQLWTRVAAGIAAADLVEASALLRELAALERSAMEVLAGCGEG